MNATIQTPELHLDPRARVFESVEIYDEGVEYTYGKTPDFSFVAGFDVDARRFFSVDYYADHDNALAAYGRLVNPAIAAAKKAQNRLNYAKKLYGHALGEDALRGPTALFIHAEG